MNQNERLTRRSRVIGGAFILIFCDTVLFQLRQSKTRFDVNQKAG